MAFQDKTMPIGSYLDATGEIGYGMTNDYMFRAVLQKNVHVLKGLICSLLHLQPDEVETVQIKNPIELGDDIDDKTFVLDINVVLNNNIHINLEMQMADERNWEERSLSYLCRSFDQLYHGQDYLEVKPVIHIGFLNFAPYAGNTEFYATYMLMNERNHRVYSDKFVLRVVDLTHIEQATKEDRDNQVDYWAKLFTATSWEELKMIAEKDMYMSEASQTLYELNADEITQQKCRARRDYYRRQKTINRDMERLNNEKSRLEAEKANLEAEKANLETEKANLEAENTNLEAEKANLEAEKSSLESKNITLGAEIIELRDEIAQLKQQLTELILEERHE